MRRFAVLLVAVLAGLSSLLVIRDVAAAQWGSSYGDPFGFWVASHGRCKSETT